MADHPEVFISATTADLGSYRREIKDALLTLRIFPIEQSNFELAYGPLTEMLRGLIERCDAVIHVAGFNYGAEPPQRPLGEGRRSYTQIEYHVARELGKPVYLFLAAENYEPDNRTTESEEEKELQLAHRHTIENCGDIYYRFSTHKEIGKRVRELRFPERIATAPRRVVNLPYESLGALFKGRDAVLTELERRFQAREEKTVGLSAVQAIYGLGGVGKTRLAIEYAWRHAGGYAAMLFISGRSPADLLTDLAALCDPQVLNLPEQARPEQAVRLAAVFRWLSSHPGWLLIFDSIDTPEAAAAVEKTLPQLQGGQVIVTSRIADWSSTIQTLELDVLSEKDAAAFLLERTESKRMKISGDANEAVSLARELGGLALALEQAGAYIAKTHLSISEYQQRFESRKTEVLAWYDERLIKYASSVAVTWQTTIQQLTVPERKLLNMLAWLAPEPIPVSLVEGVQIDDASARDALVGLVSWSLARWTADGNAFTVHKLVQRITRDRLRDKPEQKTAKSPFTILWFLIRRLVRKIPLLLCSGTEKLNSLEAAGATLDSALPSPDWDEKGWQMWNQLLPHCRVLLDRLRGNPLETKATRMMRLVGVLLEGRAEYDQAEAFFRRALEIDERSLGPHHSEIANDLNHLARLLFETNRLAQAEPLFRRALAIIEKRFGPDHPAIPPSLSNLARLLLATNRLAEAEPLYSRVLSIAEQTFGPDNPYVANALNDLAELRRATNRLTEAEHLYLRALAIYEKSLGPDHPHVAACLNNCAELLRVTNRLAQAEPLFRRALAIDEKSLGPDHPDVARDINNLGLLLSATNRLAEAEPLYSRALAITERTFGPDHPKVAACLNNLAELKRDEDRFVEAEPLYRRALKINEQSYGPEHPTVMASLNNLADFLRATNRMAEAESFYLRALAIGEKSLSADDPSFATCLSNYALLLRETDRRAQAEQCYGRALRILAAFARRTGKEHAQAAEIMADYTRMLAAMHLSGREIEARVRSQID
jgi:tetratricopeptide (TPR) repeat protein